MLLKNGLRMGAMGWCSFVLVCALFVCCGHAGISGTMLTQKELIKVARMSTELDSLDNFWRSEEAEFSRFINYKTGTNVSVNICDKQITEDFAFGILTIQMRVGDDVVGKVYLIVSKPNGSWKVSDVVLKPVDGYDDLFDGLN